MKVRALFLEIEDIFGDYNPRLYINGELIQEYNFSPVNILKLAQKYHFSYIDSEHDVISLTAEESEDLYLLSNRLGNNYEVEFNKVIQSKIDNKLKEIFG